uniref:Ubiquitin family, putative n=1 Tax=Theileria annulata TaxID=5874 RepID=A0A3B0MHU5_THEAN
MDNVNIKLLVNHYDREFKVQNINFPPETNVKSIKDKLLESETFKECNIRVIYRGLLLSDEKVLKSLPGFSSEELILTVFITKPNVTAPTNNSQRNEIWKWSTSAWIAIIATLWCYKFKFKRSFKNFSVLILYLTTFFCLYTLFSRLIRGSRTRSSSSS